ncbi:MAG: SoxR reducing system RseC family protein [Candidatus Margulisiibacteriota bacterium]
MREQGVITRVISAKLVEVAFKKNESCAKCKLCHDVEEGMVAIESVNEIGAKRDDIVEIELPSGEFVKGSMVVFLLPVLFLIAGYLIGAALARGLGVSGWQEPVGIICALVAAGASYFAVNWYDKNIQQKEALRARITKVISPR